MLVALFFALPGWAADSRQRSMKADLGPAMVEMVEMVGFNEKIVKPVSRPDEEVLLRPGEISAAWNVLLFN